MQINAVVRSWNVDIGFECLNLSSSHLKGSMSLLQLLLVLLYELFGFSALNTSLELSTLNGFDLTIDAGLGAMNGFYNNTLYAVVNKTSMTLDFSNIDSNVLITNKSITFTNNLSWTAKYLSTDGGWNTQTYESGIYSTASITNMVYYLFPNDERPSTMLVFDMKTNDWISKSPQILPNNTDYKVAGLGFPIAQDKYIYLIGGDTLPFGITKKGYTGQLLRFDTENYIIDVLSSMNSARSRSSITFSFDVELDRSS